jgi:hypothetical protein
MEILPYFSRRHFFPVVYKPVLIIPSKVSILFLTVLILSTSKRFIVIQKICKFNFEISTVGVSGTLLHGAMGAILSRPLIIHTNS